MPDTDQTFEWWSSLKTDGLLLSATKIAEHFDSGEPEWSNWKLNQLRDHITPVLGGDEDAVTPFLKHLFEDHLGYGAGQWVRANQVPASKSEELMNGSTVGPDWLWEDGKGSELPVFFARPSSNLGIQTDDWVDKRLGVGRSKIAASRVLEWMRRSDTDLALLTNGQQLRLMYAGVDFEAWAEWDVDFWFESGHPAPQLTALKRLLGRSAVERPSSGEDSRLIRAIKDTREGQAELSDVLGERVRRAVELLVRKVDRKKLDALYEDEDVDNKDVYIAACRLIMRMVVILFAEARDLLPRDNDVYNQAYGLQSLHEQLEKRAGGKRKRLRHSESAWSRILALFNLVYDGSAHQNLPIPEYGGELFRPGDETDGPVGRALEVLESPENQLSDEIVLRVLTLLTRSKTKIQVGRSKSWVETPIDFSDLSTEYIGIIYEGLLDYELKRADKPKIFLNVGDEPILEFERLSDMTDDQLADLFGELADGANPSIQRDLEQVVADLDETDDASDGDDMIEPYQSEKKRVEEVEAYEGQDADAKEIHKRIFRWAKRAVMAAGIVEPPDDDAEPEEWTFEFKQKLRERARELVPTDRIFMPGRWYLVRWGGTRKGSGTYYTRPQLVFPTVRRTLAPLCYEQDGDPEDPEYAHETPKKPEEILDLKVCDPAMGSGSFLIGALRYLTDALYDSLHHYDCFDTDAEDRKTHVRLADGNRLTDGADEPIPVPPEHEDFENRLRARLKRYVVERCIYGVDIDPLAVELGRMALWIETMDPNLPFGFIDHKIKCGNSLVGAWMDQVKDYPVVAFERSSWNGGDGKHDNGVHFEQDRIGPALKEVRNELMKPQIRNVIRAGANSFDFMDVEVDPVEVHETVRQIFEELHNLPVHEAREREQTYAENVRENSEFQRLRRIFDTWCAIWFWPFDEVLDAAEEIRQKRSDPHNLLNDIESDVLQEGPSREIADASTIPMPETWMDLSKEQRAIVDELRDQHRFFHWELEFPDVFNEESQGFDATLGNPPWETVQPESKEFFSNEDPLYRSYGNQEATRHQTEYFEEDRELERDWILENANYKSLSNWFKNRAHPFGDAKIQERDGVELNLADIGGWWRDSDELHKMWINQRSSREGFSDTEHPFRYQGGGKPYLQNLFLEASRALQGEGGRLGFIVPSGLYTDYGTQELRELFIDRSDWEWLFSFENKQGIFDIHRSFKFCPIIVEKGGQTDRIRASFMHHDMSDWDEAAKHVLDYPRERILEFSPNTKSILELRSEKDLEILTKIYDNGVLLGDDSDEGWGIEYRQGDFNMTSDSDLFAPRPQFEEEGYRPDEYGHWLKGDWRPVEEFGFDPEKHRTDPHRGHWLIQDRPEGVVLSRDGESAVSLKDLTATALPLFEGRMINQFDFSPKKWIRGRGLRALWREMDWPDKEVGPQYLVPLENAVENDSFVAAQKVAYRNIARSTDTRSCIAVSLPRAPTPHMVSLLVPDDPSNSLSLSCNFNSLVFDHVARRHLGGTHLDYHIVSQLPLLRSRTHSRLFAILCKQLTYVHKSFATEWTSKDTEIFPGWRNSWAVTQARRTRLRAILEAIIAAEYGLNRNDLKDIFAHCDRPTDELKETQGKLPPRGLWRVDSDKPPELRLPVLTQIAFQDLRWLIRETGDRESSIAAFTGLQPVKNASGSSISIPEHPNFDKQNGWQLPDAVTLADYGLGHDMRSNEPQPVAPKMGSERLDWQTAQDREESWEERKAHAQLIRRIGPDQPRKPTDESSEAHPQQALSL